MAVSRTQAFQLRAGHKVAHMYSESTVYRYLTDPNLHIPKLWFQHNIDQILKLFGMDHKLTREDVFLGKFLPVLQPFDNTDKLI